MALLDQVHRYPPNPKAHTQLDLCVSCFWFLFFLEGHTREPGWRAWEEYRGPRLDVVLPTRPALHHPKGRRLFSSFMTYFFSLWYPSLPITVLWFSLFWVCFLIEAESSFINIHTFSFKVIIKVMKKENTPMQVGVRLFEAIAWPPPLPRTVVQIWLEPFSFVFCKQACQTSNHCDEMQELVSP